MHIPAYEFTKLEKYKSIEKFYRIRRGVIARFAKFWLLVSVLAKKLDHGAIRPDAGAGYPATSYCKRAGTMPAGILESSARARRRCVVLPPAAASALLAMGMSLAIAPAGPDQQRSADQHRRRQRR
ncbi:MAG: hypothetical protein M5U16_17125 [Hyphomicrobium sp.]|nr:hypothetical protein [Hyphomicrobium sp.]